MSSGRCPSRRVAPWAALVWLCLPGCRVIDFTQYLSEESRTRARCEALAAQIDDRQQNVEQRVLAVKELAGVKNAEATAALKLRLAQAAEKPDAKDYSPQLHAELIRAVSQHVSPADDAEFAERLAGGKSGQGRFAAAKDSPHVAVRLQALLAYADHRQRPPKACDKLRFDPDSRVRAEFVRAVSHGQGVDELAFVREALQDHDLHVRMAAIDALGEFTTRQTSAKRAMSCSSWQEIPAS